MLACQYPGLCQLTLLQAAQEMPSAYWHGRRTIQEALLACS